MTRWLTKRKDDYSRDKAQRYQVIAEMTWGSVSIEIPRGYGGFPPRARG